MQNTFKATVLVAMMGLSTVSFAQMNDSIVAVVDDGVILQSDLKKGVELYSKQLQANGETVRPTLEMQQRVLDQLILRQAQKNLLKRYGVKVSEQELNTAMLNIAKQAGVNSLEEFQQQVDAKQANTYASLRAGLAEDLAIQRLSQQMVMSRIKISDQDVDNFLKSPAGQASTGSQYHVVHLRIAGDNARTTAEQVQQQLQQGQSLQNIRQAYSQTANQVIAQDLGWKELSEIPAELAVRVSNLPTGGVSELIHGQDGSIHLVKVIDRRAGAEKQIVPQYQTRHILIQPTTIVSQQDAKHMIDVLHQRVANGEDFATLASTFSTDTGSARDGGSLGWVNLGTMVPEFEVVMKNTPVGHVSQPFQTQFGWHILQVTDTRQYDMTEENQRNMARQILGESQYQTEMENWLREVRSGAYVEIKDERLK